MRHNIGACRCEVRGGGGGRGWLHKFQNRGCRVRPTADRATGWSATGQRQRTERLLRRSATPVITQRLEAPGATLTGVRGARRELAAANATGGKARGGPTPCKGICLGQAPA